MIRLVTACLFVCLSGGNVLASNSIPNIVDADTVLLNGEKIRLQGIDAPETDQICLSVAGQPFKCGLDARSALDARFGRHPWTCHSSGKDRYGRTLAKCSADGQDIGQWLVRE